MNCNFFGGSPYYYKDLEEMNYGLCGFNGDYYEKKFVESVKSVVEK